MKKLLILLAIALAGAGVYWKFGGQIQEKLDEVRSSGTGTGSPLVDAAKSIVPGPVTPKAEEKLSLVDEAFTRQLPNSLASIGTGKADLILELTESSARGGIPARLQLGPQVRLDASGVQIPAGAKVGTMVVVQLDPTSASADLAEKPVVIRGVSQPAPQALEESIRKQTWRAAPLEALLLPPSTAESIIWITEFAARAKRGELHGSVQVEGTFGTLKRGAGTQGLESVTLEEVKDLAFHFKKGTIWHSNAQEAEQLKKQGQRVTLRILVNLEGTPKYQAQQLIWRAPLKEKFEYLYGQFASAGDVRMMFALAAWAEERGMGDEAKKCYEAARAKLTRETLAKMGIPHSSVRVHLADEVQEHCIYQRGSPAFVAFGMAWNGKSTDELFESVPAPVYLVVRVNSRGVSSGDYELLNEP